MADAISYATLARLRAGARNKIADTICPLCATKKTGAAAKRKVLRTWAKDAGIGFHCVRCDIDGLAEIDNEATEVVAVVVEDDGAEEEKKRRKQVAADRIWRASYNISGTAGEAYLARRGITLDDV